MIFSEILRTCSPWQCLQANFKKIIFFSESVDLKKTKQKQNKKSTHRFLGIATYNICAEFQGKSVNPALAEAPGSSRFLNNGHGS